MSAPVKLISYIYASSAKVSFTSSELLALLEKSRKNNTALGITGMLLFRDGNFLQVLEGPEEAIKSTVEKISHDPRHGSMLKLLEYTITARQFADWSMGFRDLDSAEAKATPGYSDYLNHPFDPAYFSANPARSQKLLQVFKANMR